MMRNTYLDAKNDPADEWETWNTLEDADRPEYARKRALEWMRGFEHEPHHTPEKEVLELVLRGAAGLLEREVTQDPYVALWTSIVWYYG